MKELGQRSWRISEGDFARLQRTLRHTKFEEFRDRYSEALATDMASCTLTAQYDDGSIKTVYHYFGARFAPASLERLEKRIDSIVGTAPYVGERDAF